MESIRMRKWSKKELHRDIEELKHLIALAEAQEDEESRVALGMFRNLLAQRIRLANAADGE